VPFFGLLDERAACCCGPYQDHCLGLHSWRDGTLRGVNADDEYVSVATAADLAGIPARTLRYWVEAKKLATVAGKHGRLVRMGDVDRVARQSGRASGNVLPSSEGGAAIAADVATGHEIGPGVGPVVALVERAYREALSAKDREIAAKDELIAELRGRAERAEQQLEESGGVEREGRQAPSPVPPRLGAGDRRPPPLVQRIVRWWNDERNIWKAPRA